MGIDPSKGEGNLWAVPVPVGEKGDKQRNRTQCKDAGISQQKAQVRQLLDCGAHSRPSARDCLEHPWLVGDHIYIDMLQVLKVFEKCFSAKVFKKLKQLSSTPNLHFKLSM